MHKVFKAVAACAAILAATASAAAEYPEKRVRLVVPVGTGGGTDQLARVVAQKLSEIWAQPVVVDNRPGAGGNVGAQMVARSDPDGYTLLLTYGANITVNPKMYKQPGFDPDKDFVPVTQLAAAPYLVIVNNSVPAQSIAQLIALMKQGKEKFSFASAPVGSPDHLSGELFKMMAGVEMVNIPYKGGAQALVDVLGGRVQMSFSTIPAAISHVRSGSVRALAITDNKRSKLFPDLPTVAETLPTYEILTWYGIWAPAGTAPPVVDKVYRDVKRVLALPDVVALLDKSGFESVGSTPLQFAEFCRKETVKYGEIVKVSGATLE